MSGVVHTQLLYGTFAYRDVLLNRGVRWSLFDHNKEGNGIKGNSGHKDFVFSYFQLLLNTLRDFVAFSPLQKQAISVKIYPNATTTNFNH